MPFTIYRGWYKCRGCQEVFEEMISAAHPTVELALYEFTKPDSERNTMMHTGHNCRAGWYGVADLIAIEHENESTN